MPGNPQSDRGGPCLFAVPGKESGLRRDASTASACTPAAGACGSANYYAATGQGCLAESDGRHLLTGGVGGMVRLWEIAAQKIVAEFHGHKDIVNAVEFHPNGRMILSCTGGESQNGKWSAGSEHSIRVWELPSL